MTRIRRRADEIARGFTDAELRRSCTDGDLLRLCRGSYADAAEVAELDDGRRHVLRAAAMLGTATAPDTVLSHASAAMLHGIDLWNVPLNRVHLTRNRRSGGRTTGTRQVHAAPYEPDEVTVVNGLRVTSPARTVVDLAHSLPFEEAVCAGDDAARRLGLARADLTALLDRRSGRTGHSRARRVVAFIDARSESIGESRSRVVLNDLGHTPELQRKLRCAGRSHRVDFLLEDEGVVCEFDGQVKYGRLVKDGETPASVLWAEKLREDDLRDAGYGVARWTWADLARPALIAARIERQCAQVARRGHP